ncbi:hypothetical protein CPB85DRAFT_1226628 [Mucidula mucida]|nr:hypothetical protein CPB85DRAFT_1226628 [Mucidula mucida]
MRRAVYKVQGAYALWHHDGNEKLRPWGFYVHGCIDGHSRLLIYMSKLHLHSRLCQNFTSLKIGCVYLISVSEACVQFTTCVHPKVVCVATCVCLFMHVEPVSVTRIDPINVCFLRLRIRTCVFL